MWPIRSSGILLSPIRRPAPRRGRIASGAPPAAGDGDGRTRRAPGSARSGAARRASPPASASLPPDQEARQRAAAATVQTPAPSAVTARPVFGETKARPVGRAGHGAAREIEAVAEIGEQHASPSGSGRPASPRPATGARSGAAGRRTRADAARAPAARPRPPRRPRDSIAKRQRIVHGERRRRDAPVRALKLPSCSASRATQRTCTRLPGCQIAACAARRTAARQAAMRAVLRRHHRGDGVAFAVRPRVEHDCGCVPVHQPVSADMYDYNQ